jgi:hypothetical protein
MKFFIFLLFAFISLVNLSCNNMLDDTIFNKDKEDAVWDQTRFNKSKFGK